MSRFRPGDLVRPLVEWDDISQVWRYRLDEPEHARGALGVVIEVHENRLVDVLISDGSLESLYVDELYHAVSGTMGEAENLPPIRR